MSKKIAIVLAAAMLLSLSACGGEDTTSDKGAVSSVSDSAASNTDSNGGNASAENDETGGRNDNTAGTEESGAEEQVGTTTATADGTTPVASGGTNAAGKTTTTQAVASNSGGNATQAATTASTTQAVVATKTTMTTVAATTATEEVEEIKTINLGSDITVSGEGIAVRGTKVGITKGGTYLITGSLSDGQIEINTTKKVTLQLSGVTLTNTTGSAINVLDAKRVTIELVAGTTSTLCDGGTHEDDKGTIFTNDTLEIIGEGNLNITANYAHGICSDDDIILTSGNITVKSTKSGFLANDAIDINGGTLLCDAGTNGIKSKGSININGGTSTFIGGTKAEKGAIIAEGTFTITGGTFYAIGNACSIPGDSSTQNVLVLSYANVQAANTLARIENNYNNVLTITSPLDYNMVLYSAPGLVNGVSYSIYTGGSVSGGTTTNYITTGGTYSGGTRLGGFASSGRVSTFTLS